MNREMDLFFKRFAKEIRPTTWQEKAEFLWESNKLMKEEGCQGEGALEALAKMKPLLDWTKEDGREFERLRLAALSAKEKP